MDFQKNHSNEIHIPCMLKTDLQLGLSIFSSNSLNLFSKGKQIFKEINTIFHCKKSKLFENSSPFSGKS